MKEVVNVYHADGGEPVRIAALEEIPKVLETGKVTQLYREQGKILFEALWATLPGGTLDVLLAHLLAARASLFRVPFSSGGE